VGAVGIFSAELLYFLSRFSGIFDFEHLGEIPPPRRKAQGGRGALGLGLELELEN
jgi:hypothetical protein